LLCRPDGRKREAKASCTIKTGLLVREVERMRSGNPALSAGSFANAPRAIGSEAMTIGGTVNKTAIMLAFLMGAAIYTWQATFSGQPTDLYMVVGGIGGFVVALVTIFKKEWAPVTAPVYALLEGLLLGALSA